MSKKPSFLEDHISQIPAIQLLVSMGYTYISPSEADALRGGRQSAVLFEEILASQLQKINSISRKGKTYNFSESNIQSAILAVKQLPLQDGFISANEHLYHLLTLGKSFEQTIEGDKKSHNIRYIDWENWGNNVFHVTEELSVTRSGREDTYRPDIVLYVNGIPLVVIECKSSALTNVKTPVELGIEQHLRNSKKDGIRGLYVYSALLLSIAGNEAKYGTTGTSKEFWSKWKEVHTNSRSEKKYLNTLQKLKDNPLPQTVKNRLFAERKYGFSYAKPFFDSLESEERTVTEQDKVLYGLCSPERLLDYIRNFTLYDNGIKKVARYQQYFAINTTLTRIQKIGTDGKRRGGVIWHTQGSGKSLTMVMLAQLLAANNNILNPKIVLVTDRVDLDRQISDTFKKCKKQVIRAHTGKHLGELLNSNGDEVITTIINKFEAAVKSCDPFESADIFILIDEGHRTQYGTFNVKMQQIFPNACFLAFTGTPLMKKEKSTAQKFGGYIGTPYTVLDAVADGAVVPLLYEGRHSIITLDANPLNKFFDRISEPLSDYGKTQLKKRFNTESELNRADRVIYERAWDIIEHYKEFQTENDQYKPKAQLVAPTIKAALKYKECFDEIGGITSVIVVSENDNREGAKDAFYQEDNNVKERLFFEAMKDKYGSLSKYEEAVINQFKHQDDPEIIIVVAKLLTGFDAPKNTILYLCRSLKEHTLLQAIARVNRVYPGKDYGYIIDYFGNLENLDRAVSTYSNLDGFDQADLEGTLTKMNEEIEKLPQLHADVWDIFKDMKKKKPEIADYEEHLSPEDIRYKFYERLSLFARLLKMSLASLHFNTYTEDKVIQKYKDDLKFFLKLRVDVKRRFNDELAYKEYEPQIQKLINKHLSTEGDVLRVTELVDIFDQEEREAEVSKIKGDAAKADHIASRTKKAINVRMDEDPVFYKKLSEVIEKTIKDYYNRRITEAAYLKAMNDLENRFFDKKDDETPKELVNNKEATAYYNICKEVLTDNSYTTTMHIECSLLMDTAIRNIIMPNGHNIVDWTSNTDITGSMNIELGDILYDLHQKYDIEADWDIIDKLVLDCIKVAKANYK